MKMKTEFWYESNSCFGKVKNIEELTEMLNFQIDPEFGGLKTVDDFLDKSFQHSDSDILSFGTRSEHTGKKTLREFLKENDNLDEFINKLKK